MRWHAPTCYRPDVHVADDGFPFCRGCGKSAREMRHRREDTHSSLEPLPPDEPERRLNLWWPPSVSYTSNDGTKFEIPEASVVPPVSPASHGNQIYERPLMPNEFRLACISATPSKSGTMYPIHLSFEVFEDDHHPDYDTVSYAWGGEDNNRDHNCLIYIGDYWDILYTTRNCWDVLRYLRPWRGTRLVWLDFICINQSDMNEKTQQILKMGHIYSHCNQVFLWLGQDAVSHDQASLPSRRPLEYLQGLHQILSRNYFTRVWVVQELVLSPRISMPYGNDVFEVYPQSLENMEENLATSPAPWLSLATRGLSHNHSCTEVMRMTSQSKSSDARDSLYGVLGLWASGGSLPVPSYAISYQHMMIGMFAWLLIHEHDLDVLLAAKCISFAEYEDPLPSWIPPWRTQNFWQWFINVSSRRNQVKPPHLTFPVERMLYSNWKLGPPYGRPWHQSRITVDHNTGALSLVAIKIHVMQFDLQSQDTDPSGVWSSRCCLRVRTSKNIYGIVKEGDEIYLPSPATSEGQDKHEPLVYLFLRKVANQMHKLVLCEPEVWFDDCPVWESPEETRVDRSLAVDQLQELWHRPMYKFDEDMHTGGFLGRGLQRTFPGNEDTPFHVLLAVILSSNEVQWPLNNTTPRSYDIQRLLDNATARGFDAKITTNEKFEKYRKQISYLTFKFSKSYFDDVEALYTIDTARPPTYYEGMHFQFNGNPPGSEDWNPHHHQFWELPEGYRHKEVLYVECELPNVHELLLRIDRELCITSIWRSIGIRNPKGSLGELLYARAVYPSMTDSGSLKANDEYQRRHSFHRIGNSVVVGLESRIHII